MMLSAENLRQYCRTCFVKLESNAKDDTIKSIPTNKYPELEHLMQVCLARTTVGDDSLCFYVPFLCLSCFEKWLDFLKLYQLAIKSDEKIRTILEKEVLKNEVNVGEKKIKNNKENEDFNEYFIDTETLVDIHEIEKYGTDSPFFHSNMPMNEIQHKATSLDVSNQLNSELEPKILKDIELVTKYYEDIDETDNSRSDNPDDVDLTPDIEQSRKDMTMLKSQRNKKSRKSLCILKKSNKTRQLLQSTIKNQTPPEIQNDITANFEDNGTKKVRYKCEPCSKYFWEKNKYDGHMKQVHEGIRRPYQCLQCDKAYNLYKTLLQHKRECHSEKSQEQFKCEKCDKIFKTAVILKQHMNNKHSEQKDAMRSICDQCGFIAAHQYSLSRHIINKHTETDQIKCEHCPKVFKTQYSLKYHVISNHNPSNIKPFKCSECQMGFTRKTLLNQHKRTHLKYTERIKCDFEGCEVRFVKHGDKTHHMRLVHLKVKQHICDFCGEAFGAMQTLRHHRFIHTGEKPYKCSVCGQGFRQRTAMKTHRKTHFGKNTEQHDLINNLPEINLSLANSLNT